MGTTTTTDAVPGPEELSARIQEALRAVREVFSIYDRERISERRKSGGDPVTEADLEIDRVLKSTLLEEGEGWLSEETVDDPSRLDRELVWIVDPLDGTREFIDGLPEFCTSIAAVVNGLPIAGGVLNPAADVEVVGAIDADLRLNGRTVDGRAMPALEQMTILASRSEVGRGQWAVVESAGLNVEPMGSVAYKLARVAANLDHATWTPVPKHEWDVAGGAALCLAAGGSVVGLHGEPLLFNRPLPRLEGAIAVPPGFDPHLETVIDLIARQVSAG